MEIHFIIIVIIALIVGICVGCAIGLRAKRRTTVSLMSESGYLAMSMVSRTALQMLDSGDSAGAKQHLSDAIANFYHSFKTSDREPLPSERRQIEVLAQSSVVLADSLRKRKVADEKPLA